MSNNNQNLSAKGVSLTPSQWERCDRLTERYGKKSRNLFIREAVDFYCVWLEKEHMRGFIPTFAVRSMTTKRAAYPLKYRRTDSPSAFFRHARTSAKKRHEPAPRHLTNPERSFDNNLITIRKNAGYSLEHVICLGYEKNNGKEVIFSG